MKPSKQGRLNILSRFESLRVVSPHDVKEYLEPLHGNLIVDLPTNLGSTARSTFLPWLNDFVPKTFFALAYLYQHIPSLSLILYHPH